VVIIRPALVGAWLDVGDEVTVSFPSDKSFVFSYPARGLREELALE